MRRLTPDGTIRLSAAAFSAAALLAAAAAVGLPAVFDDPGLQLGITHTQQSADPWGDEAAVASAKEILSDIGPLQNQHLMGFGTDNPEPSPGVYEWTSLDERVALITETGGTPVITLCTAPGWMKPSGDDWNMDEAPLPEYYDDFADLALETAKRYPQVRHFQVWNEFKGFWNNDENRWDHEGYTEMYNQVYTKLKAHDPGLSIGGPYVSVNAYKGEQSHPSGLTGSWGTADQRDLDAMEYWLANKAGAEFFTIDTWSVSNDDHAPDEAGTREKFQALTEWVGERSDLPVWWSEFYAPAAAGSEESTPGLLRAAVEGMEEGGADVALFWGPECDGPEYPCLWSSTKQKGGGRATEYVELAEDYAGR